MRQRHRKVGVEQSHRLMKLKERQRKNRRRGHAVGQKPEEQLLVAEKAVARKGIGGSSATVTEITVFSVT